VANEGTNDKIAQQKELDRYLRLHDLPKLWWCP